MCLCTKGLGYGKITSPLQGIHCPRLWLCRHQLPLLEVFVLCYIIYVMKKQVYIIRKYVLASSAKEAIRLDNKTDIRDVFLEETSQKSMVEDMVKIPDKKVGFNKK